MRQTRFSSRQASHFRARTKLDPAAPPASCLCSRKLDFGHLAAKGSHRARDARCGGPGYGGCLTPVASQGGVHEWPNSRFLRSSKRIIVVLCSLSMALTSMAQDTSWSNYPVGDWFISGNWTGGVPVWGTATWITNGGTAFINSPAEAGDLRIGGIKNTSGALLLSRVGSNAPGTLAVEGLSVGLGGGPGTEGGATGTLDITNGAQVLAYYGGRYLLWGGFGTARHMRCSLAASP
jgi:hypothetical protein